MSSGITGGSAGGWLAGMAVASLGAVGVALVSQHAFDMQPCPWCVLQRAVFVAIAIACIGGAAIHRQAPRRAAAALALLLALGGVAAALWQHFQAAASQSCNLTLADRIVSQWLRLDSLAPDVFAARASCADAAVRLLGVSYDHWSLAAFALLALAALRVMRRPA